MLPQQEHSIRRESGDCFGVVEFTTKTKVFQFFSMYKE